MCTCILLYVYIQKQNVQFTVEDENIYIFSIVWVFTQQRSIIDANSLRADRPWTQYQGLNVSNRLATCPDDLI